MTTMQYRILVTKLRKKYKNCRICGTEYKKKGLKLTFHHLISHLDIEKNIIPLCEEHHNLIHHIEQERVNSLVKAKTNLLKSQMGNAKMKLKKLQTEFGTQVGKRVEEALKKKQDKNFAHELQNQVLCNKFADLKKFLLQKFDALEKELREKVEKAIGG